MTHALPAPLPDLGPLLDHVRGALDALPPTLHYHDPAHTLRDVLPAAMLLADDEDLDAPDRRLLATAALFHDLGYLDRYPENEPMGVARARAELPRFGYSPHDLDRIEEMILATAMPQRPATLLASLLCDADLAHLGTDRFFWRSEGLRLELGHLGQRYTLRRWQEGNLRFLEQHAFHTAAARRRWQAGKDQNAEQLRELLRGP